MVPTTTLIRSIALVVMTPAAQAAGDAKIGERIFNQCKPCHSLGAGKNGSVRPFTVCWAARRALSLPTTIWRRCRLRNNLEQRHARKISG
jgi:cytochrome c2